MQANDSDPFSLDPFSLVLVTNNRREFERVPGLRLESVKGERAHTAPCPESRVIYELFGAVCAPLDPRVPSLLSTSMRPRLVWRA